MKGIDIRSFLGPILTGANIRDLNPNRKLARVWYVLICRTRRKCTTITRQSPQAPSFEPTDLSGGNGAAR